MPEALCHLLGTWSLPRATTERCMLSRSRGNSASSWQSYHQPVAEAGVGQLGPEHNLLAPFLAYLLGSQ